MAHALFVVDRNTIFVSLKRKQKYKKQILNSCRVSEANESVKVEDLSCRIVDGNGSNSFLQRCSLVQKPLFRDFWESWSVQCEGSDGRFVFEHSNWDFAGNRVNSSQSVAFIKASYTSAAPSKIREPI